MLKLVQDASVGVAGATFIDGKLQERRLPETAVDGSVAA
jgi:hypothetical protein